MIMNDNARFIFGRGDCLRTDSFLITVVHLTDSPLREEVTINQEKMSPRIVFNLIVLVFAFLIVSSESAPSPFWYGLYPAGYSGSRQPNRKPHQDRGGRSRYNEICRVHAVDSLGFPGRVANPVCPW